MLGQGTLVSDVDISAVKILIVGNLAVDILIVGNLEVNIWMLAIWQSTFLQ
jgi:hypothetical protein